MIDSFIVQTAKYSWNNMHLHEGIYFQPHKGNFLFYSFFNPYLE